MRLSAIAICTTLLTSSAALADCASMWVTRNMVFDQAGYCFGSNLGQALFDNSDCTGTDVALSLAERDFIAYTREMEGEFACKIDTSQTWLEIENLNAWLRLEDMPWRDIGESGCIGWLDEPVSLHAAATERSGVIGRVLPGDSLIFAHAPLGDFDFVQVIRNGARSDLGWARVSFDTDSCEMFAG